MCVTLEQVICHTIVTLTKMMIVTKREIEREIALNDVDGIADT